MFCVLCKEKDKSFTPGADKDFICGSCVQKLLMVDQDDLRNAYKIAIKMNLKDKAWAIKTFLKDGGEDEQRKPPVKKYERHSNRKRIVRPVRNKKIRSK
jgi:hypothetical protein